MTYLQLAGVDVLSDSSLRVNSLRAGTVSHEYPHPIRTQLSQDWDAGFNKAMVCASPLNTGTGDSFLICQWNAHCYSGHSPTQGCSMGPPLLLDQLARIYHGALCFHIPLNAIITLDSLCYQSQGYLYRYLFQGTGKELECCRVEFSRSCWSLLLTAIISMDTVGHRKGGIIASKELQSAHWAEGK